MTYDTRYRDAKLVDLSRLPGAIQLALEEQGNDARHMSPAAYDAIDLMAERWFAKPGVLCCALDLETMEINLYIDSPLPGEIDHTIEFSLPLAELVLSAGHTSVESQGVAPSVLSAFLRRLADDLDAATDTNTNQGAQ
jgi:hypothetical protein